MGRNKIILLWFPWWSPAGSPTGCARPEPPKEDTRTRADQPQGVGTFSWPPAGTFTWPLTGGGVVAAASSTAFVAAAAAARLGLQPGGCSAFAPDSFAGDPDMSSMSESSDLCHGEEGQLGPPRRLPDAAARQIIDLRSSPLSWAAVAERLNELAVPTALAGRQWYASTAALAYERDLARGS